MVELEKKFMLSKEEFDCLISHFGRRMSVAQQINYYFDTDDFSMNRQNITCRIRLKDGKYKGTVKQHITNTNRSIETDVEETRDVYNNAFIDMGLKLQGQLITKRHIISKNSVCEIALDKNEYLGFVDYELEIEYDNDHEQEASKALQSIIEVLMNNDPELTLKNIALRSSNLPSKSKRFFWRKLKNNTNVDSSEK